MKVSSSKVVKHEKACFDNQNAFVPFSLDTFDFLAPEALDLIQQVQRLMNNNVISRMYMNVVFPHKQIQIISLIKRRSIQGGIEYNTLRLVQELSVLGNMWVTEFAWSLANFTSKLE